MGQLYVGQLQGNTERDEIAGHPCRTRARTLVSYIFMRKASPRLSQIVCTDLDRTVKATSGYERFNMRPVSAELPRMERRSMSLGSRLHSLGGPQKPKMGRAVSYQKFSILNELEKGQL